MSRFRYPSERRGITENEAYDSGALSKEFRRELADKLEHTETFFNEQFVEQAKALGVTPTRIRLRTKDANGYGILPDILDPETAAPSALETYERIKNDPAWPKSGVLHDSQIKSLVQTFYNLREDGFRSLVVKGPPQSGKTTYIAGLLLMGPLIFLDCLARGLNPISYVPILLPPNINDLEDEMVKSLKNFYTLYGNIDIDFGMKSKGREGLGRMGAWYSKQVLKEIGGHTYTSLLSFENRQLNRSLNDIPAWMTDDRAKNNMPVHVVKREKYALDRVVDLTQGAVQQKFVPLIILDEMQWGAYENDDNDDRSVFAKLYFDQEISYNGEQRPIRDLCADPNVKMRCVMPSATIFSLWGDVPDIIKQRLFIGPNYHGMNFDDGEVVDPTVKNTVPVVRDFDDIQKVFGVRFAPMDTQAYHDRYAFQRMRDAYPGDLVTMSHDDYREWYVNTLAKFLNAVTATGDDVIVRLINNNAINGEIADKLRPLLRSDVELLSWYGAGQDRLAAAMANVRTDGKKIAVLVSARARMGTVVPYTVRHFLDMVREPMYQVSVDQGFLGRACGYGKNPNYVYFNNEEAARVNEYISNLGAKESARSLQRGVSLEEQAATTKTISFPQSGSAASSNFVKRIKNSLRTIDHSCDLAGQLTQWRTKGVVQEDDNDKEGTHRFMPIIQWAKRSNLDQDFPSLILDDPAVVKIDKTAGREGFVVTTFADALTDRASGSGAVRGTRDYRNEVVIRMRRINAKGDAYESRDQYFKNDKLVNRKGDRWEFVSITLYQRPETSKLGVEAADTMYGFMRAAGQ